MIFPDELEKQDIESGMATLQKVSNLYGDFCKCISCDLGMRVDTFKSPQTLEKVGRNSKRNTNCLLPFSFEYFF